METIGHRVKMFNSRNYKYARLLLISTLWLDFLDKINFKLLSHKLQCNTLQFHFFIREILNNYIPSNILLPNM